MVIQALAGVASGCTRPLPTIVQSAYLPPRGSVHQKCIFLRGAVISVAHTIMQHKNVCKWSNGCTGGSRHAICALSGLLKQIQWCGDQAHVCRPPKTGYHLCHLCREENVCLLKMVCPFVGPVPWTIPRNQTMDQTLDHTQDQTPDQNLVQTLDQTLHQALD